MPRHCEEVGHTVKSCLKFKAKLEREERASEEVNLFVEDNIDVTIDGSIGDELDCNGKNSIGGTYNDFTTGLNDCNGIHDTI